MLAAVLKKLTEMLQCCCVVAINVLCSNRLQDWMTEGGFSSVRGVGPVKSC